MNETANTLLSFYDDLDATLVFAWQLIARAAVDRRAAMHTPCVATLGSDGQPSVRTVVLREVDVNHRSLRFHSDARSRKVTELAANPRLSLLGYDAQHKVQLRFSGSAKLHHQDPIAAAAWARSQSMSRACYQQSQAPGTPLAFPAMVEASGEGYENFVAIVMTIDALEWLYLAVQGHRRARFTWAQDGGVIGEWMAP